MRSISTFVAQMSEGQTKALESLNDEQKQAVVDALALAMYIDEEVVQSEIDMFDSILHEIPAFQDLDSAERRQLLAHSLEVLARVEDKDALGSVHNVARVLPDRDVRLLVFAMAVAITLADGVVVDLETHALGGFVEAFDLDYPDALRIISDTREHLGVSV